MLSCHLQGGLGNQLFQLFTTISYGIRKNRFIIIPYTDTLHIGKVRPTYWNTILSNLVIFTTRVYKNYFPNNFPKYNEPDFRYREIPDFSEPEIMLTGYFQSYLYFESENNSICSMIQLSKQQDEIRNEYYVLLSKNVHDVRLISMHFRLGDYLLNPSCHPIMPFEYYHNALSNIISNTSTEHQLKYKVLYFCEAGDNEYVIAIINRLSAIFKQVSFVKVDDTISDWKQLLIMSGCHDNIIANSSFSWWGGYFNKTANKQICYPSLWFGPALSHNIVTDMFPPNWTKIKW